MVEPRHVGRAGTGCVVPEDGRGLGERAGALGEPLEPQGGGPLDRTPSRALEPAADRRRPRGRPPARSRAAPSRGTAPRPDSLAQASSRKSSAASGKPSSRASSARSRPRSSGASRSTCASGTGFEPVREVGVRPGLAGGARADDHDGEILQALREVQQQLERGPVHPLEVVDGDQRRPRRSASRRTRRHMPLSVASAWVAGAAVSVPAAGRTRRGSGAAAPAAASSSARSSGSAGLRRGSSSWRATAEREAHLELAAACAQRRRPRAPRRSGPARRAGGTCRCRRRPRRGAGYPWIGGIVQGLRHELQLAFSVDQLRRPWDGGRHREGPSHACVF